MHPFMRILNYFIVFLFMVQIVDAVEYNQEFNIKEDYADVLINVNYGNESNFNFYLDLPKDVTESKVYFDDKEQKFQIRDSELTKFINIFGKANKIRIEYASSYYIEYSSKYYFTSEINPIITGNLEIKVILPEGATLDKAYNDRSSSSVYPKPARLETNGKNIIINWNQETKAYSPLALFLVYDINDFNYYIIIILLLIALIIFFTFKTIKKREIKIKKIKINNVEKHLKNDEKLIVNILKQKKGSCTQSTLLTLTNMSKASLSRLLDELEERNIIRKEQQGNKNLIILRK